MEPCAEPIRQRDEQRARDRGEVEKPGRQPDPELEQERAEHSVERHSPANRKRRIIGAEKNRIRVEGGEPLAARDLPRFLRVVPEVARRGDPWKRRMREERPRGEREEK